MTDINADADASSTVTVATGTGPDRQWQASAIEITDEGALLIGDGEKDGVDEILAIYAPGQWTSAGLDGHRASSGPDHEARAAALADELRVVLNIATGRDSIGGADALEAIRERVSRVLGHEAGK